MKYVLSFLLLLVLTGCWSRVEINDRAFVTSVFVDKAENGQIELGLGFPLPNRMTQINGTSNMNSSGNPYTVVSRKGKDVAEAYSQIQSNLTRKISWGHTRVIVVGREFAKEGIRPITEFVARLPSFQIKTVVMIAPGRAREIPDLTTVFEQFPSEVLREFAKQGSVLEIKVRDFLMAESNGEDMLAPLLTVGMEKLLSEKNKMGKWVGSDGAVLFRDGKAVGALTKKETRGAMWLLNRLNSAVITVTSPTDQKPISLYMDESKTKIRPILKENQIIFHVDINTTDLIISSNSGMDVTTPSGLGKLESLVRQAITERVNEAFATTQKYRTDAFQLGKYIEWYYPAKWKELKKNWRAYYQKNVALDIEVHVRITRIGGKKGALKMKPKQR